jgi:hypothetical protein
MTAPVMTSFNIIRDILFGCHTTRSRVSVFHSDLPSLERSVELHTILTSGMSLTHCRRVLLHRGCMESRSTTLFSERFDQLSGDCREGGLNEDYHCCHCRKNCAGKTVIYTIHKG